MQITLEAARINIGYKQEEAGKLFGVHYQTLAKWEENNSRMPYEMIRKIPEIYKVPADVIFFGDKNEFIRSMRSGDVLKKERK